jgi:hypothetical protein
MKKALLDLLTKQFREIDERFRFFDLENLLSNFMIKRYFLKTGVSFSQSIPW